MNRKERIADYENWIGAQYVEMGAGGELSPVELTPEQVMERVAKLAQSYIDDIKHALQTDSNQIVCNCADREVADFVKQQFAPAEWAKVHMSFFDVPLPSQTKRVD